MRVRHAPAPRSLRAAALIHCQESKRCIRKNNAKTTPKISWIAKPVRRGDIAKRKSTKSERSNHSKNETRFPRTDRSVGGVMTGSDAWLI